ncbi:hypothetical protein H8E88_34380 [candidate division KSB1 bacterium]|nr:hypothetical protein [candidate division KSB1 bacterium]
MKKLKASLGPAVAIICLLVIAFIFNGCSKDFFPRAAEDEVITDEVKKPFNLQFLSYGKVLPSLKKTILVSKFISEDEGGILHLQYKIETETGDVHVNMKLKVHKNSLPDDAEICMSIDDEQFLGDLDIVFGPHGTDFTEPADLDISVDGLDLSGEDASSIDIYYYDEANDDWIPMNSQSVKVDADKGKIKVQQAELPHFSRYALCK